VLTPTAPDGARFSHARYHPSEDLAPFVEHFWTVGWDLRGRPPHLVETLPHPSVHLIFRRGVGARLAGVARGKFTTLLEGHGGNFAAKFRPGGFYPFVGVPVAAFTGTTAALGAVWGPEGDELERAVLALNDDAARIEAVEAFLRGRRPPPDAKAALAGTITEAIAADRGLRTVEQVGRRFGLTPRSLQRLFARYVGVSPKWVIQRYRLHEAAERLARGHASQAALALSLGYADQAHFVKDFKAVVGTPPAAYARRVRP
jgi:AraC-like DNA-binding protein